MASGDRKSGIEIMGDIAWGTHLCQFYQTKDDLIDILVPYFKAGLENNEFCMWITSEPLGMKEAKASLGKAVRNLDDYIARGQLEILDYSQWYTKSGNFDADEVLQGWVKEENQALERGFDGLRLTGNTSWLDPRGWNSFRDYEATVNSIIGSHRMIAICTYSLDKCGASEILDVISNHEFALIKRAGLWTMIENAEEKRIVQSLKDSEVRYRRLFETAQDGILILDAETGQINDVNPFLADMLGYSRQQIIGRTLWEVGPFKDETTSREAFLKLQNEGYVRYEDLPLQSKTGKAVDVEFVSNVYMVNSQRVIQCNIRDITERKRAEEALQLRAHLLNNATDSIMAADIEGNIIYANDTTCLTHGYTKEEMLQMNLTDTVAPQYAGLVSRRIEKITEDGYLSFESEHKRQDGTAFPMEITARTMELGGRTIILSVQRDITERKKSEEKLADSEVRYRRLFETAQDAILILDGDTGKIIDANPFIKDLLGFSMEELLGKNMWEIGELKDTLASKISYKELHESGYVRYDHLPLVTKDGRQIAVEVVANAYQVDHTSVIQCNIRDVTERNRAEKKIQEGEEKFRSIVENSSDQIFMLDKDYKFLSINKAAADISKMSPQEMIGMSILTLFPEKTAARFSKNIKNVFDTGKSVLTEEKMLIQGGEFYNSTSLNPVRDDKGNVIAVTGIVRDITARKRVEKRLRDSKSNFQKLVDNNVDGIIVTDRQGIVQFVNPAAEIILGRKGEALKGEQFGFQIALDTMTEIDIIRKAGELVVAEMRTAETVWYDKDAYLVSLHDLTEHRQAEEAQKMLGQLLQARVSELEIFSYGIAHDLRSPLISIEGFSRELREDIKNSNIENVKEDIRLLESGVRKMHDFLDRTLEYSRSGQLAKRIRNVSLGKIVSEVITGFNKQISSIGATVSVARTFPKVYADRTRIIQALTNLIQNSIKYRDKTVPLKIEIGYRLSKGETIFFVSDNGLGIDAGSKEKLFTLFYRGTAECEGSGIGLSIVKKIIEAHGGRIWVQQGQTGKGTTMCFTLPQPSGINKGDNNGKD
jgi:PAS domain S-box-containing protein